MANPNVPKLWRWLGWQPRARGRERRRSKRYPCNLDTSCYLLATLEGDCRPVRVRNISAGGISLVVSYPIEPQTVLNIDLANEVQGLRCQVKIRVIYSLEHPNGEWILGGSFTRKLADHELRTFLCNR